MKREFPFKCPEAIENSQFGINASNYTRSLPIYIPFSPSSSIPRLLVPFAGLSLLDHYLNSGKVPPLVLFLPLHPYLLLYASPLLSFPPSPFHV